MRSRRRIVLITIALVSGSLFALHAVRERSQLEELPYSEFRALLAQQQVTHAVISTEEIRGTLAAPRRGYTRFVTRQVDPQLAAELDRYKVSYSQSEESSWLPLASLLLPLLLLFSLSSLIGRRVAAGPGSELLSIGKSKAKVYLEKKTGVSFADVAGVDEAKAELEEIVAFLKDPQGRGRLGARMPKGVLLVGPPGTGKTLLARAVAGEAGVPFFSISGSEFVEMFVGVGAARVRDLFEQARTKAPCIIFIDELDALGSARHAAGVLGSHDEKAQTLNQLLVELDGFDSSSGIVLLAATNRPEILDPALLRAGRFDRQVLVDRPDRRGRVDILRVHVRRVRLAPDLDLEQVAAMTPGFTGADLANLVNEAALAATRRGAASVSLADFTEAVERIVAGLEKRNRLLNPDERRITAFHEIGHALVASALPGCDPVHKISIVPRGIAALGYTIQRPTDDRYLMTSAELENKMAVLLGGRAAESLVFAHVSTGAGDDLAKATNIARSMATHYGMVEALGHVNYEPPEQAWPAPGFAPRHGHGDATARAIDEAVRQLTDRAFARARDLLARNRDVLERAAACLLEHETLDERQLTVLFDGIRRSAPIAATAELQAAS